MGILNETSEVYLNIPKEQNRLFTDVFRDVKSGLTEHIVKHSVHRYCNCDAILKCDCGGLPLFSLQSVLVAF